MSEALPCIFIFHHAVIGGAGEILEGIEPALEFRSDGLAAQGAEKHGADALLRAGVVLF